MLSLTTLSWNNSSTLTDVNASKTYGVKTDDFSERCNSLALWLMTYFNAHPEYLSKLAKKMAAFEEIPYGVEFKASTLVQKAQHANAFNFYEIKQDVIHAIETGQFDLMEGVGLPSIERIARMSGITLKSYTGVYQGKSVDGGYEVFLEDQQ